MAATSAHYQYCHSPQLIHTYMCYIQTTSICASSTYTGSLYVEKLQRPLDNDNGTHKLRAGTNLGTIVASTMCDQYRARWELHVHIMMLERAKYISSWSGAHVSFSTRLQYQASVSDFSIRLQHQTSVSDFSIRQHYIHLGIYQFVFDLYGKLLLSVLPMNLWWL